MPFKSEAQRRYLWKYHPKIARKWAKHTPKGKKLPKYVKNTTRSMNLDPTRTTSLRRAFLRSVRKQFGRIMGEVVKQLLDGDAFGRKEPSRLMLNADEWRFETEEQKTEKFREWLRLVIIFYLLSPQELRRWQAYIRTAFTRGAAQSFDDVRKEPTFDQGAFDRLRGGKEEFLRTLFTGTDSQGRIEAQVTRTIRELENLAERLVTEAGREVADALAQNKNSAEITRAVVETVRKEQTRVANIVEMEFIRAYVEGQLLALAALRVTEVTVEVEWVTRKDNKVCKLCRDLEGVVLPIAEARARFPRHVKCRCRLRPATISKPRNIPLEFNQSPTRKEIRNSPNSLPEPLPAPSMPSREESFENCLRMFGRMYERGRNGEGR